MDEFRHGQFLLIQRYQSASFLIFSFQERMEHGSLRTIYIKLGGLVRDPGRTNMVGRELKLL